MFFIVSTFLFRYDNPPQNNLLFCLSRALWARIADMGLPLILTFAPTDC